MIDFEPRIHVRRDYGDRGGWLITVTCADLVRDDWRRDEAEAHSLARGIALNLEQEARRMVDVAKKAGGAA